MIGWLTMIGMVAEVIIAAVGGRGIVNVGEETEVGIVVGDVKEVDGVSGMEVTVEEVGEGGVVEGFCGVIRIGAEIAPEGGLVRAFAVALEMNLCHSGLPFPFPTELIFAWPSNGSFCNGTGKWGFRTPF